MQFAVSRDAGRFDCEGYLKDGEGAGIFRFTPSATYEKDMAALGFTGIDDDMQFGMAVHDVTLDFARQMKAETSQRPRHRQAHRVSSPRSFAAVHPRAARRRYCPRTDSDKLIAFRVHGVNAGDGARGPRMPGSQASDDQLIAMRIHGATPEWIAQMKKNGYDKLDVDKLIAFRIHGVSPEFIEKVEALGFKHPEPDQLVAMRIHGVTPEYISTMKSRGMKDLTIDKLVSLRVHGID